MARRTKRVVPFPELLTKTMDDRGLSQQEIASKLGVRQQSVSKWARGVSKPRPSYVAELAQLLGLDIIEMLRSAGYRGTDLSSDTWRSAYEIGYADALEGREPKLEDPDGPIAVTARPAAASGINISDLDPDDQELIRAQIDLLRERRQRRSE